MLITTLYPRLLLMCLLTVGMLNSPSVFAEQISKLYEVTLAVPSQSESVLKKAAKEGLATLFVRVSGNKNALSHPQIQQAIKRANVYLKQFRYDSTLDASGEKQQLFVSLEFEDEQIDKLLRDAQLPLWSSNRPSVLIWMAVEDRNGRRFAAADSDPLLLKAIKEHAERRGMAVKLPLLDLEDNLATTANQVWGLTSQKALKAASRYNTDSVLVGRVSQLTNGKWLGVWLYHYKGQHIRIEGDGQTIDSYVGAGLDKIADLLAADYAVVPVNMSENGLLMRLSGIRNFTDYAQAMNYLEGVAAIRYANVVEIMDDEIIINLNADGFLQQLQQAFALDKRLLPSLGQPYMGVYPISLDYRWPGLKPQ